MKDSPGPRPRPGQTIDLPISTLAFGGQGIGRRDNFVVFVDGAVPGDVARVVLTRVTRRYAEGRLVELVEESPDRRPALCLHFGGCGGCRWQSLDYPVQLRYKAQQVRDSLERMGGLSGFDLQPIRGMDDPWRYRNKVEFSAGTGPDGETLLGFHPAGRWDTVLPLDDCRLLPLDFETVRSVTQSWLREVGMPPWDPRMRSGQVQHLTIRRSESTGEVLAGLTTTTSALPKPATLAQRLLEAVPGLVGLVHVTHPASYDSATTPASQTLWGRPHLYEDLDGLRLKISINAFFQTNTQMARVLYRLVAEAAALTGQETVWDLYAGIGSIGLSLARAGAARVLGIEIVASAVQDAKENAALNGIGEAVFFEGDARVLLKNLLEGRSGLPSGWTDPDVVVVDPPRAGLPPKVLARLAAVGPKRLVYVSCNPTTLAPNAASLLEAGYRLTTVTPVDMFPHTPHIEAVALLER
jgi:23S rRNA (uracil1939-C5)-methyltransferase